MLKKRKKQAHRARWPKANERVFYSLGSPRRNLVGCELIVAHQAVLEVHQATFTYLEVCFIVCEIEFLVLAVDDDMPEGFHLQCGWIPTFPGPAFTVLP